MADLFADVPLEAGHLTIMPVSVIDIMAQGKRQNENHGSTSSRANYSPFPNEISTLCYEFYLRDSSFVFDPFAGSGSTGVACANLGKDFIGCEIDENYFQIAERRIRAAASQQVMFA